MKSKINFIVLFLFISCTQRYNYPIGGNLALTSTFKPESYIVLADSIANNIDTLKLINYRSETIYDYRNEFYKSYSSFTFSTFYDTSLHKNYSFSFNATGVGRSLYLSNLFGNNIPIVIYAEPFELGTHINSNYKIISNNIKTYVKYTIRGKEYRTVFESKHELDGSNYAHVFYSLYDGLIKLDLHRNGIHKVYEIEESHIIR